MTWLTPMLAGIAAAIAVPALVILYFLKLRRRDVEISTTLLWKKAIQDLQANAPFQRLRRNILLLLQLVVLAGILAALAQPELLGQTSTGHQRVILIDRSASMSSLDGDPAKPGASSRLDEAKARAIALIDSLREPGPFGTGVADEAMVIAFDTVAEVRQQFTTDKARLRDAVRAIEPTDAPSSLAEAMRLARAHLPDRTQTDETVDPVTGESVTRTITMEGVKAGGVSIHLISDGRLPDSQAALTGNEDAVDFLRVGATDAPNIGLIAFRAERAFDTPSRLSIYVGIENTSRADRNARLELLIDGRVERVVEVTVPAATPQTAAPSATAPHPDADESPASAGDDSVDSPGDPLPWLPGVQGRVFELERAEGGVLAVQVTPADEGPDLLNADNRAWLVVPPARQLAVAVVSTGNLFLTTALQGLPLSRLVQYAPDEYAAQPQSVMQGFDVVIFDRWLPALGEPLPPGRFLVLGASPPPLGVDADAGVAPGVMIDWRRDHPVTRTLSLDSLVVGEMPRVILPEGGEASVLAESDRGPAIVELAGADTRALIVPFDIANSTWPFDVSFVVFVGAGVNYLGQNAARGLDAGETFRPGGVLTDRLPIGADAVRLSSPDGSGAAVSPAADGRIAFGPLRLAGLYEASWSGPAAAGDTGEPGRPARAYAVNLLDPGESDIAAAPALSLASETVAASSADANIAGARLWPWLVLAALAILMLEWYIYNRKVHL